MNERRIYKFLEALGVSDASTNGDWVQLRCPLANFTHQDGDKRPSFGISINPKGQSVYNCFGCSREAAPLGRLLHVLWLHTGRYPDKAAQILVGSVVDFKDWENPLLDSANPFGHNVVDSTPLPLEVLKAYPLLSSANGYEVKRCSDYLVNQRMIKAQALALFKIRYSPTRQCLIFPFTNKKGRIYALRARNRKEKNCFSINKKLAEEDLGYVLSDDIEFASKKHCGYWFGLHLVDWDEPVILVEGEIDALRLYSLGKTNVIASGGTGITKAQLRELSSLQVILGYDSDKGGRSANEYIIEMIDSSIALYSLDWNKARKKDKTPCKDAGDVPNTEELDKVFRNMVKCN